MENNSTELVFILDKSGSMAGLEKDTIGGYNSVLTKQKEVDGECRITTVLFDDKYELLHDRIDIAAVKLISGKEYYVGGSTALLDAIGMTINKISKIQQITADGHKASKVLFVIITDGEENSSKEYSPDKIKAMVEEHREKHGWEFLFLGANIDAIKTAGRFGIAADRAQNYNADSTGSQVVYASLAKATAEFREAPANAPLASDWNAEIEEDFQNRK
ncbi:MAG: VWA domain-containing protein [Eubacteriaceae bacterium]|nr:VWA domain-containing protein [Eubacteriaceae bacterium]